MDQSSGVRFIRRNGRIIPIKSQQLKPKTSTLGALVGAATGAGLVGGSVFAAHLENVPKFRAVDSIIPGLKAQEAIPFKRRAIGALRRFKNMDTGKKVLVGGLALYAGLVGASMGASLLKGRKEK